MPSAQAHRVLIPTVCYLLIDMQRQHLSWWLRMWGSVSVPVFPDQVTIIGYLPEGIDAWKVKSFYLFLSCMLAPSAPCNSEILWDEEGDPRRSIRNETWRSHYISWFQSLHTAQNLSDADSNQGHNHLHQASRLMHVSPLSFVQYVWVMWPMKQYLGNMCKWGGWHQRQSELISVDGKIK